MHAALNWGYPTTTTLHGFRQNLVASWCYRGFVIAVEKRYSSFQSTAQHCALSVSWGSRETFTWFSEILWRNNMVKALVNKMVKALINNMVKVGAFNLSSVPSNGHVIQGILILRYHWKIIPLDILLIKLSHLEYTKREQLGPDNERRVESLLAEVNVQSQRAMFSTFTSSANSFCFV